MKVIILSIVAALAIGLGAALALRAAQRPAYDVYATPSTRVGEPGHNLVGPRWNGQNAPGKG